ncbi:MAG: NAD-dependent epimerase/dehydratase family protein [Candidatus Baltobacteraceae bacterium]|jgi:CDP-glucose 4,6-dehydratase
MVQALSGGWRERRVLVTGATGIVGSWLCAELVRRGAHVVAFVLDDDPLTMFYAEGTARRCSIVRGNLHRYEDCARAINAHDVEVVFHLGAQTLVETALRDPLETFESNLRGTYNLLEAARRMSGLVKTVVVASSDKAYGDSPELPYFEDMPLAGRHPYDVSKSCTDLLASCYFATYGLPVAVARCGNIFGGGDLNWSRIVPGTIRSLVRGERPVLRSDGTNVRDYIYVKDVVAAYLTLAENVERTDVKGEAFNFGLQSRVNVLEIVRTICTLMEAPFDPVIRADSSHEIKDQTLSSVKAHAVLGWEPAWTIEQGLRETIHWYRAYLAERAPGGAILDVLR